MAGGDPASADAAPGLFGYCRAEPARKIRTTPTGIAAEPGAATVAVPGDAEPPRVQAPPVAPASVWYAAAYGIRREPPRGDPPEWLPLQGPPRWTVPPAASPTLHPLATWPDLRRRLTELRDGPALDVERTVARVARGLLMDRLPHRRQRRLGGCV